MGFYLGIDAGGTRTTARLVSDSGETLGTGEGGPANTRIGVENALLEVERAYKQAIAAAGLSEAEVGSIRAGLGIAGLNRRGALEALQAHSFPFASIAFASDAAIACMGAHARDDGGVGIVRPRRHRFARVAGGGVIGGGYGFPISDGGSGGDPGRRGIQQGLGARDRRIDHSAMTREILER